MDRSLSCLWSDETFKGLNDSERVVYLYLLTNQHTNILGLYAIPMKVMLVEIGFKDMNILKVCMNTLIKKKLIRYDLNTECILIPALVPSIPISPDVMKPILESLPKTLLLANFRRCIQDNMKKRIAETKKFFDDTVDKDTPFFEQKRFETEKKTAKKRKPSRPIDESLLNEFWAAYPRKEGWEHLRHLFHRMTFSASERFNLLSAAKNYAEECTRSGIDAKYITLPSNFVQNGKYLDYVAVKTMTYKKDEDVKDILSWEG